jgi:acyl dehydratase
MLKAGDRAILKRIITADEIEAFAEVSLDRNPLHLDEEYASGTMFGHRIAHGMLAGSMFSAIIAHKLPGLGSIYLSQSLDFRKPVYIGDEITATVEVIQVREDKPICTLKTTCVNQKGDLVIEGEAVVMYPK